MKNRDEVYTSIFESLRGQSWAVVDSLFSPQLVSSLEEEASKLYHRDLMESAHVGRGNQKKVFEQVRRDSIYWIDSWESNPSRKSYKEFLQGVLQQSSRELFLSLKSMEGHFSAYSEGDFYAKHYDQHAATRHRQISTVFYLSSWAPGKGGELVLYPEGEKTPLVIEPIQGRFVCFLSGEMLHEVLPSHFLRLSLTTWLRDDTYFY